MASHFLRFLVVSVSLPNFYLNLIFPSSLLFLHVHTLSSYLEFLFNMMLYHGRRFLVDRSGDRSKVIAAPITASVSWKQVIWHQRKNSSHHSFPPSTSHVTSFPHFLLLLWLLSSGSQLLPVNNFLEVARTGCSISDVTCPALHTLLSVHPMMPGRTDFSLSSIPDVLCDIGQIVVSLQSWVSSFEKKRIANNSIYTVGFWYILSEWMNEWIKSIIS